MDFLLKYELNIKTQIQVSFTENLNSIIPENAVLYVEKLNHLDYIIENNPNGFSLYFGDVIKTHTERVKRKGVFYSVLYSGNTVKIMPDDHGFLPVYYFVQENFIYVSSSILKINKLLKNNIKNEDFYTEISLVYSNLNGSTIFKEVKRLEYGDILEISESYTKKNNFRFFDYFVQKPKSFEENVEKIADKFIEISKYYLDKPCAVSLTGGFDGRTVTSCAHYHKTDFFNFSYGKKGSGDVDNPEWLAKKLGLKYDYIELGETYLEKDYTSCMKDYISFSGGFNGFQSPQSVYYAKKIAEKSKIIVTGYLGSEVLANAHSADEECTPQTVIDRVKGIQNEKNYAHQIFPLLSDLHIVNEKESVDRVLKSLDTYFSELPNSLTNNQKFAVYCFENVYRNTFGVWIYNSMHFVKLRVPFMDNDFLENITKTEVSQFYREFLETRMQYRIFGQLLYPNIMKKTWPTINALNSSKGYAPKDILSLFGKIKIAYRKKLKINRFKEHNGLNKLSTISGALNYLNNSEISETKLNKERIQNLIQTNALNRSLCFLSLSKFEFEKILNSHIENH